MPYWLSTENAPFSGQVQVEWYNWAHQTDASTSADLAYRIISCHAAAEHYQQETYKRILGGTEALASLIFSTIRARHQRRTAILAAGRQHYATRPDELRHFERAVSATTPCDVFRDRLAHWVPVAMFPVVPNVLAIVNPRHSNDGRVESGSTLIYTQEELRFAYIAMTYLVEVWSGFQAYSTATNGTTKQAGLDHLLRALNEVDSIRQYCPDP